MKSVSSLCQTVAETGVDLGSVAEWATVGLALVAVILSFCALVIAKRSERHQLFVRLHELMTSPDSQAGRRILHDLNTDEDITRLKKKRPGDFDLVNRAVGLYNTLGLYAKNGDLPLKKAKEHWGGTLLRSWPRIALFVKWRRTEHEAPTLWPDLVWLAEQCGVEETSDLASHKVQQATESRR